LHEGKLVLVQGNDTDNNDFTSEEQRKHSPEEKIRVKDRKVVVFWRKGTVVELRLGRHRTLNPSSNDHSRGLFTHLIPPTIVC
jgi:hypothetical protein